MEKQLDQLVSAVIIDAARKVMTDLVCREHFLPFAVSVLASLARLFVIERKVLSEVRGIRTEMNLLFATECNPGPPQEIATARTQAANEDLGFEMNVQNKPKPDALSKTRQTGSLGNRADSPKHVSTVTSIVKPSSGDDVPLPTATALEAREPSLYQAVAKHVDTTKFSVQIRNRISVSLPQVLGNTHGKNSEKNSDNPRLDSASATKAIATKDEITVSNTVSKATERRAVGSSLAVDDDMRKQRKFSQEYENGGLSAKASADASDSDDIDDIFDVLEDT